MLNYCSHLVKTFFVKPVVSTYLMGSVNERDLHERALITVLQNNIIIIGNSFVLQLIGGAYFIKCL